MRFINPVSKVEGTLRVPSDKSISHRAIMLSSINEGTVEIENFLRAQDCLRTLEIFKALGVKIEDDGKTIKILGQGKYSLTEPLDVLDAGNSGTTIRLISGILAGQPFYSVITGDKYLRKRPMDRIANPLRAMGAKIFGRQDGKFAPLTILGRRPLKGIDFSSPKASAQVKSAVLLAGLYTNENVKVKEPAASRDHTERMLRAFGVDVFSEGKTVVLGERRTLRFSGKLSIPADISSAAFFMAAAAILPDSEVLLKDVIVNKTRAGILSVLSRMGAGVEILNKKETSLGEEIADIRAFYKGRLKATEIAGDEIPTLIDELPVISVLAAFAEGVTKVKDAAELRVKESDRIKSVVENLKLLKINVKELPDGFEIEGKKDIEGGVTLRSYGDHRIAMAFSILALGTKKGATIDETDCILTSYPSFFSHLRELSVD